MKSETSYLFTIWEDENENNIASDDTSAYSGHLAVAAGESDVMMTTTIDPGEYYVIEDGLNSNGTAATLTDTTINAKTSAASAYSEYTYVSTYYTTGSAGSSSETTATTGSSDIITADATGDTTTFNIYNVYTNTSTTSVTVTKKWEDDDDAWGLRPESVTVQLYQGETAYGDSVTLSADGSWTYTWTDLPKSNGGTDYVYTIKEVDTDSYYTSTDATADNDYTITNTLKTGNLTLTKTVKADSSVDTSGMTFDFVISGFEDDASATVTGTITYSDGTSGGTATYTVSNGKITVSVPAGGSVTLTGIPVGAYTVKESGEDSGSVTANGHTWTVTGGGDVTVSNGTTVTSTITNTIADTVNIVVTKYWVDSNNANDTRPALDKFTVTLVGSDGSTYTYTISNADGSNAAWSSSSTSTSDYWNTTIAVPVYDSDGNNITYTITETSLSDYTLDYIIVGSSATSYKTYSDDSTLDPAADGKLSEATITPASSEIYATLSNSLDTASIKVTKTLLDSNGEKITSSSENDDDFTMRLYTYDGSDYTAVAARTLTLTGVMEYTFPDLQLGTYYLKEELASDNLHAYTVTVTVDGTTVTVNDDGYYEIKLDKDGATVSVSVTNREQSTTLTLPSVTKIYSSEAATQGYEQTFTFYIMDSSGSVVATSMTTAQIGETNKAVTWDYGDDAFTYAEVGTYVYTIREYDSLAAGIEYDDTVYTLVVTVYTDSYGNLQSSYKIYTAYYGEDNESNVEVSGDSAKFTNIYNPEEITFFMIVRKVLTGRTITAGEFSVTLQEYTYDDVTGVYTAVNGTDITVYNRADSTFSHTFTYDAEGTYYYKAYENKGTEFGMTYDSKTNWIKVVVEKNETTGALQVTYVGYVQFETDQTPDADTVWTEYSYGLSDYVAFQNTYEAEGSTTLTAYKDLDGRTLTAEEFTFLLVALDTDAPMSDGYITADADDEYYSADYVALNQNYVTATNNADGSIDFGAINYTQDDIGKTYEYRVKEIVGTLNGVTYDTSETGKLIYVAIADGGNGKLEITVYTSGSEDVDSDGKNDVVIYNTFSQGETSIAGTKTWVDGGQNHTAESNANDVKLKLYRTTDTTITDSTEWKNVTTDRTGVSIVDENGYINTVVWTTASRWTILNLPMYDEDGNPYTYKVEEISVDGYTTKIDGTDITNTIKQEYITLSGTKTWVDGLLKHNASDITLVVTRDGETLTPGTDYNVTWTKGSSTDSGEVWSYSITYNSTTGLDKYNLTTGAAYTYVVTEQTETDGIVAVNDYNYTVADDGEGNITNTRVPDAPVDSTKAVDIGDEDEDDDNGDAVAVDDEITYAISYYNNNNTEATVTITDVLDKGVDFVSAGYGSSLTLNAGNSSVSDSNTNATISYDSDTRTVTWIFTAAAFENDFVTLTVKVNENAKVAGDGLSSDWDDTATVDNQATVIIGGNESETNIVTNPLDNDDSVDPEKSLLVVAEPQYDENTGDITGYETQTDEDGDTGNLYVSVDDRVVYSIKVTNNTNTTQTYYVVDTLDEGVDFISSGGTYTADGTTLYCDDKTPIIVSAHSVYWKITIYAYSTATLTVTVAVNEKAKTADQTYEAVNSDGTTYTGYTYTDTASIANQAAVYSITNGSAAYTDVVENPLEPEDPVTPVKTETYISNTDTITGTVDGETLTDETVINENTVITYNTVNIGDIIEYDITYYNYTTSNATITITDMLDNGVSYVDATGDDGEVEGMTTTYDEDTRTVTWVIKDVAPLSGDSVKLQVQVTGDAIDDDNENTVENQATVYINEYEQQTNIVENPVDDDPGEPTKAVAASSSAGVSGASVSVGDEITYVISYYNNYSTEATVNIYDYLDEKVTFVSATDQNGGTLDESVYDSADHKVTWPEFTADPYEAGTVTVTVEVKEGAQQSTVKNTAWVQIGDDGYVETNPVENEVDDDPEDPTKTETGYGDGTVDENGDISYDEVAVGDEITYTITYYNHYGTEADITITDQMDPGVEFVSATDQNGDILTADDVFVDEEDTYVKWPVFTAEAYESGSVTLTVRVTEDAKTADSDGNATVDNQAGVQIGNDSAVSTNKVTNPLEPDDPTEPTKSVDVGDGTEVYVGDKLVYTVTYYNNLNTAATVTIADELDEGVDFVEASDDGVYDADTHTVTWTIEDVSAFTEGCVTLTVKVNEDAKIAEDSDIADVVNDADVTVGNQATQTTNLVENPLESTDPTDPTKSVDVGDGTKVSVRDKLVYTITYDNHLNTSATITITDTLDEGLTFVSASNGGKYDKSTRTVTWTIENVDAYTEGSVTLKVKVNSDADTSVENTAEVSVGDNDAVNTNTVENPVEQETTTVTKTKTGDSNRLSLWIVLLLASAAGLGSLGIYEKKRRRATNKK